MTKSWHTLQNNSLQTVKAAQMDSSQHRLCGSVRPNVHGALLNVPSAMKKSIGTCIHPRKGVSGQLW